MTNAHNENNDIQVVVFATCDEMLREGTTVSRISGRKVSVNKNVPWSHTTVTPYVTKWHKQRAEKELEAIMQTHMSQGFVKALHKEVEERVVALRKVDAEQMQILQVELQDMIETNSIVESELSDTKKKLAKKTEQTSQATALAEQNQEDKLKSESIHKDALEALQDRYDSDVKDLKLTIENNHSIYNAERTELKDENKEAIQKLTEQKDELHSYLKDKTAECAEAVVRADQFEKVTAGLELERIKSTNLTEETVKLKASIETLQQALESTEKTNIDSKNQRDIAQKARETVELELKEIQNLYQEVLIKAAVSINEVR